MNFHGNKEVFSKGFLPLNKLSYPKWNPKWHRYGRVRQNCELEIISAKGSILDVWEGFEYTTVLQNNQLGSNWVTDLIVAFQNGILNLVIRNSTVLNSYRVKISDIGTGCCLLLEHYIVSHAKLLLHNIFLNKVACQNWFLKQ